MAHVFSFERYVMIEIAIVLIGAIFLIWKRPQTRLRLRLKSPGGNSRVIQYRPRHSYRDKAVVHADMTSDRPPTLNVHFNYNGHSFDAYEVLGLPAGCSWTVVQEAYKTATAVADPPSRDFLQAALSAIEKHLKNHVA